MLKTLLEGSGEASLRTIAAAFLARDESQLEYYEEITKAMPGKVLAKHDIVEKLGASYRLKPDIAELSADEREELIRSCDEAVKQYLQRRGTAAYDHRRSSLGYISGSVRYEILKRAGGRCELCGVSIEERAIEIDHITPRKHGGTDELENLQALCYKCNANKGARDSTNFRSVREGLNYRMASCIFCDWPRREIVNENELAFAVRDRYPVTSLHTLVVSKRHSPTYFDLSDSEKRAVGWLLDKSREEILNIGKTVEGFNIGINIGEVAGQTIHHAHVHLIGRRRGDVRDPRGGVRGVIPGKASY
jgi:ATP adenylyltransferase